VRWRSARGDETLERGGDSPEGLGPSSGAVVLQCSAQPSSEMEVRSRVARHGGLTGHGGSWVAGLIRIWVAAGL
jgi:hypothetical protein